MRKLFPLVLALIGIVLMGCPPHAEPPPKVDLDAIKSAAESLDSAYAEASNANDPEAIVAYYTNDAHSMPPNSPTMVGKEAILNRLKNLMAKDTVDDGGSIAFETVDIFSEGEGMYATQVGKWTYTTGDGQAFTGKYMSLLKKQDDGSYLCIRDIWNDDHEDKKEEEEEASDDME